MRFSDFSVLTLPPGGSGERAGTEYALLAMRGNRLAAAHGEGLYGILCQCCGTAILAVVFHGLEARATGILYSPHGDEKCGLLTAARKGVTLARTIDGDGSVAARRFDGAVL